MPLLDRGLTIKYGSLQLGGAAASTNYHLADRYVLELGYDRGYFEGEVVLATTTEALMVSLEQALFAAMRLPRQRLTITLGSTERLDADPADYSGFSAWATCRKTGTQTDTARSARYQVRIEWELPADLTGQSGRREARIDVQPDAAGLLTVDLSGVYTAISSATARATHDAQCATWAGGVLTALSATATWRLLAGSAATNDENTLCQFRRRYAEDKLAAYETALADATLIGQTCSVDVREAATPGGAGDPTAQPPKEVVCAYSASVAKATTDLPGKWEGTILPSLKTRMAAAAGGAALIFTEESPRYDWDRNAISATVRAYVYETTLVEQVTEVTDELAHGWRLVPVTDGVRYSQRRYSAPWAATRTVVRTTIRTGLLGPPSSVDAERAGSLLTDVEVPDGWLVVSERRSHTMRYEGLPGEGQQDLELVVEGPVVMVRWQGASPEASSGGRGAGANAQPPDSAVLGSTSGMKIRASKSPQAPE